MLATYEFVGGELDQAVETILDPLTDLVVIRGLVNCKYDFLPQRQAAVAAVHNHTATVQSWWDNLDVPGTVGKLVPIDQGLAGPVAELHLDSQPIGGFVASVNLSDESRWFFATRQAVPQFLRPGGLLPCFEVNSYSQQAKAMNITSENWTELYPGDAAFFGALPYQAVHAARGETKQGVLVTWAAEGVTGI